MKTRNLFIVLIILVAGLSCQQVFAKKQVKIATIGAVSPFFDASLSYQQKVDAMKDFLGGQIAQVILDQPDLIVLPEVCDRPRGMNVKQQYEYYKVSGNQIQDFLSAIARENHCYIAFGKQHKDDSEVWRNSCVMLDRDGEIAGVYDKNFPTPREMKGFTASDKVGLIHTDFGTVGCAICFDLNFKELRERYAELKPDLLIYIGLYHGGLEQTQWAYSCRSWFVGSVGVGNLPSQIRNPFGEVIASSSNHFNYVVSTVNIDCELAHLDHNQVQLRALKKKYGEKVIIHDPSEVAVIMITSEEDNITAEEMVKEFDIETVDQYFDRTRSERNKQLKTK